MFDVSSYRMVSIGIVAEDKLENSKFIHVYPVELLPFIEGEIDTTLADIKAKGIGLDDREYSVKMRVGITVKAEWQGSTNRVTSPNVRLGEQVYLYTLGDTEKYYWVSTGRDDGLRRLEKVVYAWNAAKEGTDVDIPFDTNNHYHLTIDTIHKVVAFHTTNDNGELCKYDFMLDTDKGHFTIKDSLGNIIQLDSKNTKITLQNADGTWVTLDKVDIDAYAPRDCHLETGRDVLIDVGRDMIVNVGRDYKTYVKEEHVLTVGKNSTTTVDGNCKLSVVGKYDIVSGKYTLISKSTADITTATKASITAGTALNINTPVTNISGILNCPTANLSKISCGSIRGGSASFASASHPPTC